MKIIVIDNGGQYCHRIYRTFQDLGVQAEIKPNTTPFEEIKNADGLALSGSGVLLSAEQPLGNCPEFLDKFSGPIIGLCAGHQLIASHFGGKVQAAVETESQSPEFGKAEIIIDKENEIFNGIPQKFTAWVSHNDTVVEISEQLEKLAHSETCEFEAIKHISRPIYGLQFHPEVQHTEHGREIYKNFVNIVKNHGAKI